MTDSELLDRVTVWLASRGLTPTPGEGLWDACSGSWGASSPPALGCLLAMVREAWGEPDAHPTRTVRGAATAEHRGLRPDYAVDSQGGGWHILKWSINRGNGGYHDTIGGHHHYLPDALVAALEAAPQVTT